MKRLCRIVKATSAGVAKSCPPGAELAVAEKKKEFCDEPSKGDEPDNDTEDLQPFSGRSGVFNAAVDPLIPRRAAGFRVIVMPDTALIAGGVGGWG